MRATLLVTFSGLLLACGSTAPASSSGSLASSATGSSGTGASASSASTGSSGNSSSSGSTSGSSASGSSGSGSSTGASAPDPGSDGPYGVATISDSYTVSGESSSIPVTATYPVSGPSAGPFPAVIIAHGFQLPASAYDGYAHRLATFGYVALNVDYPDSLFSPNHAQEALDLLGALDWAAAQNASSSSPLAGQVDAQRAGITGHSLGGKLSILAAAEDARVKAIIALDPVDDSANCSPSACPTAASRMPLSIPTGFLGETLDEQAGSSGQACAPASENFQVLYGLASSPSLEVNVLGADHMSFLDSTSGCFVCSFCQPATAPQQQVLDLSRAMVAAFYERYLRGDARYDAYLDGSIAQQRYVSTSQAEITSK